MERLGRSGDPGDVALLRELQDDPTPAVRRALAFAYGGHGGEGALAGLARLATDPDPEVMSAAVQVLASLRPSGRTADARATAEIQAGASRALAAAYGRADAPRRGEIADALQKLGTSLRDAVEAEARLLWERNLRALSGRGLDRAGAAEELGHSGRTDAARRLLPLLSDGDPRLALGAVRGLGSCADAEGRHALEELVLHGSAEMAEAAAAALAELGDPATADVLATTGAGGRGRTAAAAAAALEELPATSEAGIGLCEVALRSPDPGVAGRAARAVRSRDVECPDRPVATRIARRGPETAAALAAYGELRPPGERPDGPGARALALLEPPIELSLRMAAARALGKAGYAPARGPLGKRARVLLERVARSRAGGTGAADGADVQELGTVAVALAGLRSSEAAGLAQRLAADPDPHLRAAAAEAFGSVEAEGSMDTLAGLLRDPEPAVRAAAAESLGRRGAAAAPVLTQALATAPEESRRDLLRAIGETGAPDAVPAVAPLLDGPLAAPAAQALSRIGAREGVAPLLALLSRGSPQGRLEAIEALGQLGDPGAGPALVREMTSDRPEIRAAAARAAGKLRHDAASARLEALRSDYYGEVRRAAIEALAKLPVRAAPVQAAPAEPGQ